jgi:hypothetical protein
MKEQLGMPNGINTEFGGKTKTAAYWIGQGGVLEDATTAGRFISLTSRYYNHFLDPLKPRWDQAGLELVPFIRFESSVRWAQRTDQDSKAGFGNYSWKDARRYYLDALRRESKDAREQAFAETFRALGQVMHLVVDASVPEHVRNDPHPLGFAFGNYEYWVSDQHSREGSEPGFIATYLSTTLAPDTSLFDIRLPEGEGVATVPIARLFDSDLYNGSNPWVTGSTKIGIAEVANANFLSEDTRHGQYAHPARANMEPPYVRFYTKSGLPRRYYKMKLGFGLPVDPVAEECLLNELTGLDEICVDPEVWRETALKMLPRAVGYSKAVLDYFFRGTLDLEVKLSPADPAQRQLTITNTSAEPMAGNFSLYSEDANGVRSAVGTFTDLTLTPGASSAPLTFAPLSGVRAYVVVFQGTLGAEEGAVVGKVKPWDLPIIIAIQDVAELTQSPYYSAHLPIKQQARGRFYAPGEPVPGEFITGVFLYFDYYPDSPGQVRLKLNGIDVQGHSWNASEGPAIEPITWEIVLDLPDIWYQSYEVSSRLPRAIGMITRTGKWFFTPLLWWRYLYAFTYTGTSAYPTVGECVGGPSGSCAEKASSGKELLAEVFFGDGNARGEDVSLASPGTPFPLSEPHTAVSYIPADGIEGYPVGTQVSESQDTWAPGNNCPSPGATRYRQGAIFGGCSPDGVCVWKKNRVELSMEDGTVTWKPVGTCTNSFSPQPFIPTLRFRRDYLPDQLALFQELNITPPEYEITLR